MAVLRKEYYTQRNGIQNYFKEYNIQVLEYDFDTDVFMVDKFTGKKLCPFYKV